MPGIEPNWTWVRLHTDKGIVGLGESYPGYEAHRGALKELAPLIIGKDPTQIERLWQDIFYRISYQPWGGAETRMLTAINIAQWDILGKAAGLPVYKLLGRQGAGKAARLQHDERVADQRHAGAHRAGKAGRVSAQARHQGDQDLSLRPRSGERVRANTAAHSSPGRS